MNTNTVAPLTIIQVHVSGLYGELKLFQTVGEAIDYVLNLPTKTEKTGVPLDGVSIVIEYDNGDLDRHTRSEIIHAVQLLQTHHPADIQM